MIGENYSTTHTTRKPLLLLRFVGVFLFRFAARQFLALLFQDPPRNTRSEPLSSVRPLDPGAYQAPKLVELRGGKFHLRPGQ